MPTYGYTGPPGAAAAYGKSLERRRKESQARSGYLYGYQPKYRDLEQRLAANINQDIARQRQALLRRGYDPATVGRMLAPLRARAWREMGSIYNQEAQASIDRIRQDQLRREQQRRETLGFLAGLPFQIWGMNIMRRSVSPVASTAGWSPLSAPVQNVTPIGLGYPYM